jgi:hypothetical protein
MKTEAKKAVYFAEIIEEEGVTDGAMGVPKLMTTTEVYLIRGRNGGLKGGKDVIPCCDSLKLGESLLEVFKKMRPERYAKATVTKLTVSGILKEGWEDILFFYPNGEGPVINERTPRMHIAIKDIPDPGQESVKLGEETVVCVPTDDAKYHRREEKALGHPNNSSPKAPPGAKTSYEFHVQKAGGLFGLNEVGKELPLETHCFMCETSEPYTPGELVESIIAEVEEHEVQDILGIFENKGLKVLYREGRIYLSACENHGKRIANLRGQCGGGKISSLIVRSATKED